MKKAWLILISILIITSSLIMFNKNDDTLDGKINVPLINIDFKNVCDIKIDGHNGEGYANIVCEIAELDKRKELYEDNFLSNISMFIDTYTEEEKSIKMIERINISTLDSYNVCALDRNNNLKNGDIINISCDDTYLDSLGYKSKNKTWSIELKDLKELETINLDIPESLPFEEIKLDTKTEHSSWQLEDGTVWLNPVDITDFEIKEKYENQKVYLMVPYNKLEIAKKKAIEHGNIYAIYTGSYTYYKESNFETKEETKGIAE